MEAGRTATAICSEPYDLQSLLIYLMLWFEQWGSINEQKNRNSKGLSH